MSILNSMVKVHNRYRILRLVGQGGQGAVYEATDLILNRRVALKQLLHSGAGLSYQFEREAQLLANLSHPALPRVSDYFADGESQFIVMDFVPGDDLAQRLHDRRGPFPVEQVLQWGMALLDVLHYLHTHNPPIIHRDIKPANLKLSADDSIVLLDFGVAKGHAGDSPPPSSPNSVRAVTEGYAAPEQAEGTGTNARTDLYAVGATLYVLLTNIAVKKTEARLLALARKQPDPLRPPHEHNRRVPVPVSHVVMKALELQSERRPATALAMRLLLQATAGSSRSAATPALRSADPAPAIVEQAGAENQPTEIERLLTEIVPANNWRKQKLDELYADARRQHRTNNWEAVVALFWRIRVLDRNYPDPDHLLADAQKGLTAKEQEVASLYRMGIVYIRAQSWRAALQSLQKVEQIAPGYLDTRVRLEEVRLALARARARPQ